MCDPLIYLGILGRLLIEDVEQTKISMIIIQMRYEILDLVSLGNLQP